MLLSLIKSYKTKTYSYLILSNSDIQRNQDRPSLLSRLEAMNSTSESDIQVTKRREVQSFESDMMPPPVPVCSSSINAKKTKM